MAVSGPSHSIELLESYLHSMTRGQVQTAAKFICSGCAGYAYLAATACGELLSLHLRCPCSVMNLDRISMWAGWEVLQAPQPPTHDPCLRLAHHQASRSSIFASKSEIKIPCPYCGAPLATEKARQCLVCSTDWHDPNAVVRRKNTVWVQLGLEPFHVYVLQLCQDVGGMRFIRFRLEADPIHPDCVFDTEPKSSWQWVAWGDKGLASHVITTNGVGFTFDVNGTWLTWFEVRGINRRLRGELEWDTMKWSTPTPPVLAVKS